MPVRVLRPVSRSLPLALLALLTVRENNEARWRAAYYEDDYVKVNGEWKYQHLRVHGRMSASYAKGWANQD